MFSKCANPDCDTPFDYRSGRFFRFHRPPLEGQVTANRHSVQHFWLCKACSETSTLEASGTGVVVRQRQRMPAGHSARSIVAA
jgi:hypothetical protein